MSILNTSQAIVDLTPEEIEISERMASMLQMLYPDASQSDAITMIWVAGLSAIAERMDRALA